MKTTEYLDMRLGDFIVNKIEIILVQWDDYARSIWPVPLKNDGSEMVAIRDHAREILLAMASDMKASQNSLEQDNKSKGLKEIDLGIDGVDYASARHGTEREMSGFKLPGLVAEYRALRATVVRLWRTEGYVSHPLDLEDIVRFNEAMDQSLTQAIFSFTEKVNLEREIRIKNEERARRDAVDAHAELEKTLADLRSSHWHIKKLQEALPICVKCGRVKSKDEWEDVIKYLRNNAMFLSHSYCPNCLSEAE